jgi:methylmalonyl-CoA/ethylmalonyl-CoA epimerase
MEAEKSILDNLDHIGIAVSDLKPVIENIRNAFGAEPAYEETIPDQNVHIAGYRIGGTCIEYFEPASEDSPIKNFLEKRGNGIHHLAFRVENLEAKLAELQTSGYRLIDTLPRIGAGGKKIAFLHPESFNGILIELCEY